LLSGITAYLQQKVTELQDDVHYLRKRLESDAFTKELLQKMNEVIGPIISSRDERISVHGTMMQEFRDDLNKHISAIGRRVEPMETILEMAADHYHNLGRIIDKGSKLPERQRPE
jgi:hypothetical protein